jgi:hypothetical protein
MPAVMMTRVADGGEEKWNRLQQEVADIDAGPETRNEQIGEKRADNDKNDRPDGPPVEPAHAVPL